MTDAVVDPGYQPPEDIGITCMWCKEPTFFTRPEENPPEGLQMQVECQQCGKTTAVPAEVFSLPARTDEVEVSE